jgi:hypothetical protein
MAAICSAEMIDAFTKLPIVLVDSIISFMPGTVRTKACKIIENVYHLDYYNGLFIADANQFSDDETKCIKNSDEIYCVENYYGLVVSNEMPIIITSVDGILTFRNFITNKLLYRYDISHDNVSFAGCFQDQFCFVRNNDFYYWRVTKDQVSIECKFPCLVDFIMCMDEDGYFLDEHSIYFIDGWFNKHPQFIKYGGMEIFQMEGKFYRIIHDDGVRYTEISEQEYLDF